MRASPEFHVEIDHIRKHYDRSSFLYRLFWGEHPHHGYWDADQSPAQAQVRLMERLAEQARVPRGARIAPLFGLRLGRGRGNRPPAFNRPFTEKMTEPVPYPRTAQSCSFRCLHAKGIRPRSLGISPTKGILVRAC